MSSAQSTKAKNFLNLHHAPELLVLPNIWDPAGALLLQDLGFPAAATASAAVAFSQGCDDGERIEFDLMVDIIRRISGSVSVPVTADIESGFARDPEETAANLRRVLEAGAVGVNIEDSRHPEGDLYSTETQCRRLSAVRSMASDFGVHLVINARTDVFLGGDGSLEERVGSAVRRGRAYMEAGADCLYPIGLADLDALKQIRDETGAPLNVYASASAPSIAELEAAGISRLSFGPSLFRAAFSHMKDIATGIRGGRSAELFDGALSSAEIRKVLPAN